MFKKAILSLKSVRCGPIFIFYFISLVHHSSISFFLLNFQSLSCSLLSTFKCSRFLTNIKTFSTIPACNHPNYRPFTVPFLLLLQFLHFFSLLKLPYHGFHAQWVALQLLGNLPLYHLFKWICKSSEMEKLKQYSLFQQMILPSLLKKEKF